MSNSASNADSSSAIFAFSPDKDPAISIAQRYLATISFLAQYDEQLKNDIEGLIKIIQLFIHRPTDQREELLERLLQRAWGIEKNITPRWYHWTTATDSYKALCLISFLFLSRLLNRTDLDFSTSTEWLDFAYQLKSWAGLALTKEEIKPIHSLQNPEGLTLWHMTAYDQNSEALIALLSNIEVGELSHTYELQDLTGWTLWHTTARNHSSEVFVILLSKVRIGDLFRAHGIQDKWGWTFWHYATLYQSDVAISALLEKCKTQELSVAFSVKNHRNKTCFDLLAERDHLTQCRILELLLSRQDLTSDIRSQVEIFLKRNPLNQLWCHRSHLTHTFPQVLTLCPAPSHLCLTSGWGFSNRAVLQNYFQVPKDQLLSVKVIGKVGLGGEYTQQGWVKRLQDYAYGRNLRRPMQFSDWHKWDMRNSSITPYKAHRDKTGKIYSSTSKTAISPLNDRLTTFLFGANAPHNNLVFLLLSVPQEACRALSMADFSSYRKRWVGTLASVQAFQRESKIWHYSLTQFDLFRKRLDWRENLTPEVLATLTREMVLAVGFSKESLDAYQEARTFRESLKTTLGKTLPLIYLTWSCGVAYLVNEVKTDDQLAAVTPNTGDVSRLFFHSNPLPDEENDEYKHAPK